MKLIFKYMKPFVGLFILLNLLLFMQAFANLSLPDYMSRMINEGIQNSGLPNAMPDELSPELLKALDKINPTVGFPNFYEDASEGNDSFNLKKIDKSENEKLTTEYNKTAFVILSLMRKDNSSMAKMDISKLNLNDAYKLIFEMDNNSLGKILQGSSKLDELTLSQVGRVLTKLNYISLGKDITSIQMHFVLKNAAIMFLFIAMAATATIIVNFLATYISSKVARNLRKDLFQKIMSFSQRELNKFKTSSLITRTTDDITQVQDTLGQALRLMFYSPIMGIWGYIMAYRMAPSMSFIIGLSILSLLIIIVIVFFLAMPKFEQRQKNKDDINLITRENLTGLLIVRAFNNQDYELEKFQKINQENKFINVFVQKVNGFLNTSLNLIMGLTSLAIIWFGMKNIADSQFQIGNMIAFLQYSMQIIISFILFAANFIILPRAIVSLRRINEVITTEPKIIDNGTCNELEKGFDISLKNVYFKQENADDYALSSINLDIIKGEIVAIVGATGAGKTTLINLLLRFVEPSSGEILINGKAINDYPLNVLRDAMSISLQKSMLLQGTVRSNLNFSGEHDDAYLSKILEIADCNSFLEEKGGLDAKIAQLGANLSGGQKQRLSIARCIAKDAGVYIFDDSFSALDTTTDANIRESLKKELNGKTIIIISQRINTIIDADKIIVLDEGMVVGVGKHDELIGKCSVYDELVRTQMGGVAVE